MVMKYFRILVMQIRTSFSRFIAILAIAALGVGFLAGLQSAGPDMYNSMDAFYDEHNFWDIFIKSTLGLTQSDVESIKKVAGVKDAAGVYVTDMLYTGSDNEAAVVRLVTCDFEDENRIASFTLTEGRTPDSENECVVISPKGMLGQIEVGQEITLGTEDENVVPEKLTVVGKGETPAYYSIEREPSKVGSGYVKLAVCVKKEAISADYFTDIYVTVDGAKDKNCFGDDYQAIIDEKVEAIKNISDACGNRRFEEVVSAAKTKVDDAEREYNSAKSEAEKKFADAESQLANAKDELDSARKTLDESKIKLKNALRETENAEKSISEGRTKLNEGRAEYENGKAEYEKNVAALEESEKQVENLNNLILMLSGSNEQKIAALKELESTDTTGAVKALLQLAAMRPLTDDDVAPLKAAITQQKAQAEKEIAAAKVQLEEVKASLDSAQAALAKSEQTLNAAQAELEKGKKQYSGGKKEYEQGEKDYAAGLEEYNKNLEKFNTEKADAEKELDDAKKKIDEGKAEIEDIEYPRWYVLDRNSSPSYVSFSSNAGRIVAIAKIFPVFFFLVAALVALTTMTRMVDEERVLIGTLKATGYSNRRIIFKYAFYSLTAGIAGSVIGLAVGLKVLPAVIWNAYSMMYTLPALICAFNPEISLTSAALLLACILLATVSACAESLKEAPARLMLPRAPKAGKRVFLENIKFIWKHMSFIHKVTARNILRYKKRFFMTVIGVAGCTALLLTGFGIRDAIGDIVSIQYGQLQEYDLTVTGKNKDAIIEYLTDNGAERYAVCALEEYTGPDGQTVNVMCAENNESFADIMRLRHRRDGKSIDLGSAGTVISEKYATKNGLKKGDILCLTDDGREYKVPVGDVCEYYINNYVFISESDYGTLINETPRFNTVLAKMNAADEDAIMEGLLAVDGVESASFSSAVMSSFENMLDKINYIVYVLIICAGLLAFTVLYNLTNINIGERQKEIATIKVLGFFDNEVSAYICRETVILSIIGTLLGLAGGVFLCRFVVLNAEMDSIMFGRNIKLMSFVLAAAITMIFSCLVNAVMYRKLKKIDMVESLKSVD